MKLVIVETVFDPDNLAAPMAMLLNEATAVRGMTGCRGYDLYSGMDDGRKIVVIQRWTSMEAFDTYRQSEAFSRLGRGLRPMMIAPPVTTISEMAA